MTAEAPPQPFDKPWHAGVFALAVHLSERGVFTWPEWTEAVAARLAAAPGPAEGNDAFYLAWIDTLMGMLEERGGVSAGEVEEMRGRWAAAYAATPHGEPVTLAGD